MFSVAAGLVSIAIVFIIYRSQMSGIPLASGIIKKTVDMSLARIRQTAMKNGIREWDLEAASADLFENEKKMVLNMPEVKFFMKDGTSVFLTADTGILKTDSKAIMISGNINVKRNGHRLIAETLEYEPEKRTLRSNKPVLLSGDSFELTADTVVLDIESEKTIFKGNVKGLFSDKFNL